MLIDQFLFKKHLEEGENILYAIHKHWMTILKPLIEVMVFGFAMPWILLIMGFNTSAFFWLAAGWTVMAFIRLIYVFVDWYSDAWLITNMSLIVIEWNGIFSNLSSRSGYDDIEGATYEIKGFWGTVLRYGNMSLRLMSGSTFKLEDVAKPKKAELALGKYQAQIMSEKNMQDADGLKTLLSDLVSHHIRRVK